ncbi:hypothetical protein B2J88_12005 [Rhodococcus sp. SRB_17]|uniref:DUF2514 family protein n=1 Tax=Acidovorax sp. SRB_24 TaxID=1962700 RepID=UPI00145ED33E|nr:DUF2514 family protein [Acidovorax sp. SRB_24]NMM75563.1 hypothetical protein [Acidovorax sp. SRB_24]NMM85084.1 hypothetical protein [Rhodococcus sp. SRB_17]
MSYGWQCVALALAVGLLVQTQRLADANTKAGNATTMLAAERATAELLARQQSEAHRETERKLREDHDRIDGEAQAAIAAAAAGADRARTAGQRLQRELADYIAAHRARALAAAAAGQCAPENSALDLLADLQRRADDRAGELAAVADDARSRGLACERTHDSDRATLNAEAAHAQAR